MQDHLSIYPPVALCFINCTVVWKVYVLCMIFANNKLNIALYICRNMFPVMLLD